MDYTQCMPWDVRSSRSVRIGAVLRPGSDRNFWRNEALIQMRLERDDSKVASFTETRRTYLQYGKPRDWILMHKLRKLWL